VNKLTKLFHGVHLRDDSADAIADPAAFARFLDESLTRLRLSDSDFCEDFDISVDTVERWRSGRTTPHPAYRRLVVDHLKALLHGQNGQTPRRAAAG
jgi:hypothetical protein